MNPIRYILTYPERKELIAKNKAAIKDYNAARKRLESAIGRKATQLQHEYAKDVQSALHERMRIETSIARLCA